MIIGPIRVLLLEDSPDDVALFRRGIEMTPSGFDCVACGTLAEGLTALAGGRFDVIVVDLGLPDSNGRTTLLRVQEHSGDAPVVVLSGEEDEPLAIWALQHGAEDYIFKEHADGRAVGRSLRYALERRRWRDALKRAEGRFRQLFEQASDGILLLREDFTVSDCNRRSCESLGSTRAELIGKSALSIFDKLGEPHVAEIWAKISADEIVTVDDYHVRRDRSKFPVEIRISSIELGGRYALALVRDTSDRERRKAAEQQVQLREREFEIARQIQGKLFADGPPVVAGFDIAGVTLPAAETGGDYFDFEQFPSGRLGIPVGDVSGHGVGPAMLMAETRALLRAFSRTIEDLPELLAQTNRLIAKDVEHGRFVVISYVLLDPPTRRFHYCGAGHPAHLLRADGRVELFDSTNLPLGVVAETEFDCAGPIEMSPGDVLLVVTDGLFAVRGKGGAMYGDERHLKTARRLLAGTAQEIIDGLCRDAAQFAGRESLDDGGPAEDDITIVVVKCE